MDAALLDDTPTSDPDDDLVAALTEKTRARLAGLDSPPPVHDPAFRSNAYGDARDLIALDTAPERLLEDYERTPYGQPLFLVTYLEDDDLGRGSFPVSAGRIFGTDNAIRVARRYQDLGCPAAIEPVPPGQFTAAAMKARDDRPDNDATTLDAAKLQEQTDAAITAGTVRLQPRNWGTVSRYIDTRLDFATAFGAERPEADYLVEPIFPRGRSAAIFAPGKSGKSLLALYAALGVATGKGALGTPPGPPVNVLYLDLEMTAEDVIERAESYGFTADDDWSHLVYQLLPNLPPLDTARGGEELLALALHHKAQLVIIDTYSRVLSGPENDADTIRAYFRHTASRLKAAGITVVRIDHAGKDQGKGQRGSSAKVDDVDVVWQLTPHGPGRYRLTATHRRMSWVPEVVNLHLVEEAGIQRWVVVDGGWPAGTKAAADQLEDLGVPLDAGYRTARKHLLAAGHPCTEAVARAAVKFRKEKS